MKLTIADIAWSTLGAIGRSPAVRLTILVPVLGYLLLLNYEFLKFMQLVSTQSWAPAVEGALAPPTKLILTYLGLCSLGLASVIFVMRCPIEPKAYASEMVYSDAANASGDPGTDFERFHLIARQIDSSRIDVNAFRITNSASGVRGMALMHAVANVLKRTHGFYHVTGPELLNMMVDNGGVTFSLVAGLKEPLREERIGLSRLWFTMQDFSRPASRRAVLIFYAFGFLLIAVPTVWTVGEVIWQIARVTFRLT